MDNLSLLTENELIIAKGQHTFVEVGLALQRIRDGKLYPQETFAQYLRERWPWISTPHSYHLISAANVTQNLDDPPDRAAVAHQLAIVKQASQVEAWELAKARSPKPTVAVVQQAAREVYVRDHTPDLYDHVVCGDVAINEAYAVAKRMKTLPTPIVEAIALHGYPTESGVQGLLNLYRFSEDEFDDLARSGHLQDGRTSIRLSDLTERDVQSYIDELKRGQRIARIIEVADVQKASSPSPILDGHEIHGQLSQLSQLDTMLYWFPNHENTITTIRQIQERGGTILFVGAYFNNPTINFSGVPAHPNSINGVKPQAIVNMIEQLTYV